MTSTRWKIFLGVLCIPAIGFITLRVTFLAFLLIAQLVLLPSGREIDEFPRLPFWLDLAAMAVALVVIFFSVRELRRFGNTEERDESREEL